MVVVGDGGAVVGAVGIELAVVSGDLVECLVLLAVVASAVLGGDDDRPAKKAPMPTQARTSTARPATMTQRSVRRVSLKTVSSSCFGCPSFMAFRLRRSRRTDRIDWRA